MKEVGPKFSCSYQIYAKNNKYYCRHSLKSDVKINCKYCGKQMEIDIGRSIKEEDSKLIRECLLEQEK